MKTCLSSSMNSSAIGSSDVSFKSSVKDMPKIVLWFWRFCWAMFGLSFFTSKSGLSIFSSLLILVSFFFINWKAFFKEKWLVLFAATVPLGMFLNLFSLGGWESSIKFLGANPWPLMVVPGYLLNQKSQDLKFFLWPLSISLVAAMLKSASIFYGFGLVFTSQTRVPSFFDIGRWGQFVGTASVVLLGLSYPSVLKNKNITIYVRILFVLSFIFLVLSNTRGPWLGFAFGSALTVLLMRKYFKAIAVLVFAVCMLVFSIDGVYARVSSIFTLQKDESGRITSENTSNAGRLHMWKVAIDRFPEYPFFGTGFRNSEQPVRDFLAKQDLEYLNKYTGVEFSYNDAHSSYLQTLLEMGIFFFIFFWFVLLCALFRMGVEAAKSQDGLVVSATSTLVMSIVVFIFYSSYAAYESVLLAFAFVLFNAVNSRCQLRRYTEAARVRELEERYGAKCF